MLSVFTLGYKEDRQHENADCKHHLIVTNFSTIINAAFGLPFFIPTLFSDCSYHVTLTKKAMSTPLVMVSLLRFLTYAHCDRRKITSEDYWLGEVEALPK